MISVIIPFYNAEDKIEKCIFSVLNQTYSDYEMILIDDCSTDNSYNVCKKIVSHHKNIRLIKLEKNSGVSIARNKGFEISCGEYIAFIDADDEVAPEYLYTLVKAMEANKADLVCCKHVDCRYGEYVKVADCLLYTKTVKQSDAIKYLFNNQGIQPVVWGKMFKKELIEKAELTFDEKIAISEDILYVFEYLCHCEICVLVNEALYYYTVDYPNGALYGMSSAKKFNPKWLSAWDASKKMLSVAEKKFGKKSEEYRIVKCSHISRARMQLHLLYPYNEQEAQYQKRELIRYLKSNWIFYWHYDYSGRSRKIMVSLASFFPEIEYIIWKKRN